MEPTSSGLGREYRLQLQAANRHAFAVLCGNLLRTIYPDLRETPADGVLDRSGIDHCWYSEGDGPLLVAFQCKGFEVPEWESSQTDQCLESIASFERSGLRCGSYSLAVNRVVKGDARRRILDALAVLRARGQVDEAHLLDREGLIRLVFTRMEKIVEDLVMRAVERVRQESDETADVLYLPDVPFQVEGEQAHLNPLDYAYRRIVDMIRRPDNKRTWTFVVSEFGFGKTELTRHLTRKLLSNGISCLCLQAAAFPRKAFDSENELMWTTLELLHGEEVSRKEMKFEIQKWTLKEILKSKKDIALILDGVDEHPTCWREDGLRSVFGVFKTFNASCVFAVRREFLAERSGAVAAALKGCPGQFTLTLTEWGPGEIEPYAQQFKALVSDLAEQERIEEFRELVAGGRYVERFGDIPRRPLFLKMLITDIASGLGGARNIAELYQQYFRKKFEMDRQTSAPRPMVGRPLESDEDPEKVCGTLFEIMTKVAAKMYVVEADEVQLTSVIEEDAVTQCAQACGQPALSIKTLMVNTVLVPIGKRDALVRRGRIRITFAHRSFQEFFLARHVFELLESGHNDELLSRRLPSFVLRFLSGLFTLAAPPAQEIVRRSLEAAHAHESLVRALGGEFKPIPR